tara:strand:- start:2244 stop:2396 length:153 start_codon:yes stop_codon:yes gene_type:complete
MPFFSAPAKLAAVVVEIVLVKHHNLLSKAGGTRTANLLRECLAHVANKRL